MKFNKIPIQVLIYSVGFFPILYNICATRSWGTTLIPMSESTLKYIPWIYFLTLLLFSFICFKKGLLVKKIVFPKGQALLLFAVILLYLGPIVSTFLGYKRYFDENLFVHFIALMSATLTSYKDIKKEDILRPIKFVLLFYVYASLILIVVKFNWAVVTPYYESVIGIYFRLFGVANHPNNISGIVFLYIILYFIEKSKTKMSTIHLIATLLVVILAQSKTVIIISFLILLSMIVYKMLNVKGKRKLLSISFLMFMGVAALLTISAFFNTLIKKLNIEDLDFQTFTGRSEIWALTIEKWKLNKLFGYGNGLWDPVMQSEYKGMYGVSWAPFHSHNQFFQTLGTSGILGILGLVTFGIIILYLIFMLKGRVRYGLLLLFTFVLIRGFTEPVFSNNLNDGNFITTFFIILLMIILLKNHNEKEKRAL